MRLHASSRGRAALNVLVLLAGCLTGVTVTSALGGQQARAS